VAEPEHRLPLAARQGLLVAFPSTVSHEVQPVTHGERLTVVNWFTANE
jgi:SM-20-related protein